MLQGIHHHDILAGWVVRQEVALVAGPLYVACQDVQMGPAWIVYGNRVQDTVVFWGNRFSTACCQTHHGWHSFGSGKQGLFRILHV
jgi:hypothetical protein